MIRFLVILLLTIPVAWAQDQSLPDVGYEHPGGTARIQYCAQGVEKRLGECALMPSYSESQIGAQILCRSESWRKYFVCAGMRPCAKCKPVRRDMFMVCE